MCALDGSYSRWRELRDDRTAYRTEKQRVADTVIEQLEKRFPGLREQIEVVDVSTPVTVERYTGNTRGLQAWMPKGGGMMSLLKGMDRTLPGLEGFHMAGQWTGGIGVSTAAIHGSKAIQTICKRDGRSFVTSVPPAPPTGVQ